jgi:S-methylmethionine-dependent homocysteine/selenocysteine methylase
MTRFNRILPQMDKTPYLTDGGLETTLIFHKNLELREFAAFELLNHEEGKEILEGYFEPYLKVANSQKYGFVLDTPTWRANPDWGRKLGYTEDTLADVNRRAVQFAEHLRDRFETDHTPIVVNGVIGPRGDGYVAGEIMTPENAEYYHSAQIETFAKAGVDLVTAVTMTNVNEAIGIAEAARLVGIPVAIAFTVETDGRLPSTEKLSAAIQMVDAATGDYVSYYMINCAHPTHFLSVFQERGDWISRLRGIRANASKCSHEELDNATELDDGDPVELAGQYRDLLGRFSHINVLGGCCGTDHRHVEQIGIACRAPEFA